MHIKQLVFARHDHVFAVLLDCRPSRFNSGSHELGRVMTQLFQFALEGASADFINGATRIIRMKLAASVNSAWLYVRSVKSTRF